MSLWILSPGGLLMTEAVQAPATGPAPEWEKHRIGSISKDLSFIRLIDHDDNNDEYKADEVNLTEFRTGDIVHAWIEHGRLKGIRFPPGMEPITDVPKHTGKPATPETPQKPPVEVTGDVSFLNATTIQIGSNSAVFINGVALGDIKLGNSVKAKISGNQLVEIEKFTPPVDPSKLREGHGIIEVIDLTKPFLSYKFSWKDKATNELKSAVQEFSKIIDEEVKQKASQFKAGDKISVKYSGGKTDAVLYDIEKDTRSWNGQRFDPVVEAKRLKVQARIAALDASVRLYVNGNPGKQATEDDESWILNQGNKFTEWVMGE